ncbi:MAG: thiamine pyrophosphate-binding protein [Pseudomonadota bacterium]|nr:thiamine pyrophosphate-binding protein [Pseudomonadota bacterium]
MKRRGANLLVETLVRAGTRYVFAVSGNHVMSIFDAVLDSDITLVHVRHEAAAVHMADAWARMTGEVGVALVTGGPGHANAVSALYTALASQAPVILLSGHAPRDELGRGAFQEMRQADLAAPVTKAAWTAERADTLGALVASAMRLALSGTPGPVSISLPSDVLEALTITPPPALTDLQPQPACFIDTVRPIARRLAAAQRPVMIAGPALATLAGRALQRELADTLRVPLVVMESPRGIHDPSLGRFGDVLARADAALLIGKAQDFTLRFGAVFDAGCEVHELAPDSNPYDVVRGFIAAADGVQGAPAEWSAEVTEALQYRPASWGTAGSSAEIQRGMHPLSVCSAVQTLVDAHPEAILVSDGGEFCQWIQAAVSVPHRIINGPAGAIGPGLPFALAAKLARPGSLVVAAIGDGTFGFHMSELDTARRYGLPIVVVVGNDARWNAEYQIQLRAFGPARALGCELLPTRYEQVAQALGGHGQEVSRPEDLPLALEHAVASGLPACVNVSIQSVSAPRMTMH